MDKQKNIIPANEGKKPITGSLKKMKIGDVEVFPIERLRSVASVIDSLKLTNALDFSTKRDTEHKLVLVTRTA